MITASTPSDKFLYNTATPSLRSEPPSTKFMIADLVGYRVSLSTNALPAQFLCTVEAQNLPCPCMVAKL